MPRTVLLGGAWDEGPGYPRATALRQALQQRGVQVVECRAGPLLEGAGKRAVLRAPWRWPGLLWRWWRLRRGFRRRLAAAVAECDPAAVLVPYPGHLLVRDVARAARAPVVLDLFLSAYDTAVCDRRMVSPRSPAAWLLRALDRRACRAADLVLLDTPEHAARVAELTGLGRENFDWVPVGDPDAPSVPAPYRPPAPGAPLELLFFGTGVPLHGTGVLLAALARVEGVRLTLIGGTAEDRAVARHLGDRVELGPDFVERDRLQQRLDRCHLVAGVFGTSAKAQRVVPFKVVHALASGRPVITAATDAVRRCLSDGVDAVLVPAGDPDALAARLRQLAADPGALASIAAAARATYERHFSPAAAGERLAAILAGLQREAKP